MDKYIRVKNCNCISDATIEIVEKSLNIKYGSNGTGKSTISEAIYAQANNETDRLKDFKPYGSNDNSQPTVDNPYFHVVKVFNEDYVNSYLFQGDEFLDDSFQVFLKSDKCDSLAAQIERMLEELQDLINNIDAIHNLRTFLPQYTAAVKASDGTVSRRGGVAEFVNGNGGGFNHYSELKAYKPFYSRDLPSVAKWAKWRNDGIKQMCGNDCPFCTNILPSSIRSQNEIISKVFKNSALSVANAVLEYVQQAVDQGYILPDAVDVLESYIGDNTKADELYAELQMLVLHGNWNEEKPQSIAKKSCPLCGYPMQLKYKRAYGLRLYICTNEPEICGFMTNDYRAGKLCIQKCDKCRDGYLVVKSSKENGYFLGCTNYKTNGTGCNKSIGMKYYYDQMGYRMEIVTESPVAISRIEKENPVKRVAVTQVSTDDYVEIEKTTAASVRYKRWILNNVVDTVLRALQDVSKVRYYGVTMLMDILRGANSKRILDNGLEMVPEYGMLKEIPRETIQNIIEWLINEHYILKTKEKYPVLHSTYEGLHYSESLTKTKLEELKAYLEKDEA